ncbi:MAG TPA: sugar ABC transporter substrate-binding protein [Methylomirabilota bacterium]|jgi:ABC-type glycerol-3-phosphate transport system substrate-binding protein|nr:sugar ABC transporter substrate-binding protein [Methylomirabilota bacterium]
MILTRAFAVAATVALALGLAAEPAAAQKKISLLTWNIPVYKDKIQGWIEDFKKIHPDVQVEWLDKKGPEWGPFYQTQVVAGTAPDIIDTQGAIWLEYAANGGLVDLTPYLTRDAAVRDWYNPRFLSTWVYEGKNYMVPFYISKTLLFYNKTMMAEAGLTKPPQSFDELVEAARKMTKGEKSGFMTLNFDWLYWSLFAMNGVELLTPDGKKAAFNTPAAVKTLEALARATSDGAINKVSWTGRWVEPNNAFASGTVGLYQAHAPAFFYVRGSGPWINADTLGVTAMPGGFSTPNSHGFGISKSSKHPDLAWDFIKVATNEKWAYTFGTTLKNLTGTKVDSRLLDHFQKEDPLAAAVLRTQLEHLDKLVATWPIAKDSQVKEAFYSEFQAAVLGKKPATAALAEAERKVNRLLAR